MNAPIDTGLDLYEITRLCEGLGVQQRVEELCVVAGISIAAWPRHILEIGVYGGGSFALWCALARGRKLASTVAALAVPLINE